MHKGFTLIELLVVIAIVGILAGMSIQLFEVYRESAYKANVISTAKNILTAANAIVSDMPISSNSSTNRYSAAMGGSETEMRENKMNYTANHNGLGTYMPLLTSSTDPNRLRYSLNIAKNGVHGAGHFIAVTVEHCRVYGTYVINSNVVGDDDYWLSLGTCP